VIRPLKRNAPDPVTEAIQSSVRIDDFLPPPDQLVLKQNLRKVTINLSAGSLNFFQTKAKVLKVPYQQMIKQLLDLYVKRYQDNPRHIDQGRKQRVKA
jgi:predicted DNA binding CopG/RHH family protein